MANAKPLIAISAPVAVVAAEANEQGEPKGPAKFSSTFYTGGALEVEGWELPVVVDLSGLEQGNVLVANLDHDRTKRVGNFEVVNDGKSLIANGSASAATPARDEVVQSARDGYQWQASLEVKPAKGGVEAVKKGQKVTVNGQTFEGPLFVTRKGTLKGFAFVSHGADDNTTAAIAAIAATQKEKAMDPKFKEWVEAMGFDAETLSEAQLAGLQANYAGKTHKPEKKPALIDGIAAQQAEADRIGDITEIALAACERKKFDFNAREVIASINDLAQQAIDGKWTVDKFRLELLEAQIGGSQGPYIQPGSQRNKLTNRIVEAAICTAGRLSTAEKDYTDQELQAAHDRFRNGIGLKELFCLAAEANGYKPQGFNVDINVQRAAFGMTSPVTQIRAQAWSTIDVSSIVAATANKFIREGWMAVDQTPMRIAAIRSVRDFKQITTVSLTGGLLFDKLGAAGEIKHGTLGEQTYTNQVDTYARMLAITRQDIINDDLGALTAVPRRLGRGGMLKLNDIFWTAFLNNSAFFTTARGNANEGVADMTSGGLAATETLFLNQTDEDGLPLSAMPSILLVPTALKAAATALMTSENLVGGSTTVPGGNIWRGRFRIESSPYMSNSAYTGYSAAAWYMLADPNDIPVIEIAALNGRVEPTVETADADFNSLGIQMRGYSDVGVSLQEYRGGVRADGGSS